MGWDDHTTTTNQSAAKGMPPLTTLLAASPWMLPAREIRPSTGNINHNNSDDVASIFFYFHFEIWKVAANRFLTGRFLTTSKEDFDPNESKKRFADGRLFVMEHCCFYLLLFSF